MFYQNLAEIRSTFNGTKGQGCSFPGILLCLLDSVALKASNQFKAETRHWWLWATTFFIYRQHQLLISAMQNSSKMQVQILSYLLSLEAGLRLSRSAAHSHFHQSHSLGFIWCLVGGQHSRIHPAVKYSVCSDGRPERWARSCSCPFHNPFINKVRQKTTNFPQEVIYIILFDVADWKELAGLDSNINVIECYCIVWSLMAVPEDGGCRRGAASVQTREVKNAKENHQGGRITVK